VHPRYLRALLAGTKHIELRLSTTRRAPFGRVHPGDTICLLATARRGACIARVRRVLCVEHLSPSGLARLRRTYNHAIGAPASFWQGKRGARYATLLWLVDIAPVACPPTFADFPGSTPRSAWHTIARQAHAA
jgi:predicted transcriptional regulator